MNQLRRRVPHKAWNVSSIWPSTSADRWASGVGITFTALTQASAMLHNIIRRHPPPPRTEFTLKSTQIRGCFFALMNKPGAEELHTESWLLSFQCRRWKKKTQCQMYARSAAWHSPLAHEANTMKDALVSPEVVMNIHAHMYTANTETTLRHRRLPAFISDFVLIWQQMWMGVDGVTGIMSFNAQSGSTERNKRYAR